MNCEILADMHVLLAPIQIGGGAPQKIADALSFGHLVFTTELGLQPFVEFERKLIFPVDEINAFSLLNGRIENWGDVEKTYDEYFASTELVSIGNGHG